MINFYIGKIFLKVCEKFSINKIEKKIWSLNVIKNKFFRCGHCKKIAPELEKAAKTLNKREKPIVIGKVDATIESDLASRFDVTGYPTMVIFRKGKKFEYNGPRNEPGT